MGPNDSINKTAVQLHGSKDKKDRGEAMAANGRKNHNKAEKKTHSEKAGTGGTAEKSLWMAF